MRILAIESSCDETAASVVDNGKILSNIIYSQTEHNKYGGVIPEIASRAHLRAISTVVNEALNHAHYRVDEIEAIAVTSSPGLAGALLVGTNFAKGLGLRLGIPVLPVNHIEGHLFSGFLASDTLAFPFISLVVSGGHTSLFYVESFTTYSILGSTRDDAAGEAFDKTAKMLGLGYPGGPLIDKWAKGGNPKRYDFPRGMNQKDSFVFSYSGLKTSVRTFLQKEYPNGVSESDMPDICASIQEAIIEPLVTKSIRAAKKYGVESLVIAGGVSANSRLRNKLSEYSKKINIVIPDIAYCIDNAAMIGLIAEKKAIGNDLSQFMELNFTVNSSPIRAEKK